MFLLSTPCVTVPETARSAPIPDRQRDHLCGSHDELTFTLRLARQFVPSATATTGVAPMLPVVREAKWPDEVRGPFIISSTVQGIRCGRSDQSFFVHIAKRENPVVSLGRGTSRIVYLLRSYNQCLTDIIEGNMLS